MLGALAGADPPKAAGIARALALSTHSAIAPRLSVLWTHGAPPLRAVILDVIARRDPTWAAARMPDALRTDYPGLLAVVLRLARRLPTREPAWSWDIDQGFGHASPSVREEAMATGFVFGSKAVWGACRRAVSERESARLPFALLALSPDERDLELLRTSLKDPASVRQALWALGFAGTVDAAEAVVAFLTDEKLGALAAEAFSAITGLAIDGRFRAVGPTRGPEEEEVRLDDPPPEVRPEDHLPSPAADAVAEWWRKNQDASWHGVVRHLAGGREPWRR